MAVLCTECGKEMQDRGPSERQWCSSECYEKFKEEQQND
jgi:hypothetical protein